MSDQLPLPLLSDELKRRQIGISEVFKDTLRNELKQLEDAVGVVSILAQSCEVSALPLKFRSSSLKDKNASLPLPNTDPNLGVESLTNLKNAQDALLLLEQVSHHQQQMTKTLKLVSHLLINDNGEPA